jgi:hypothetical protein
MNSVGKYYRWCDLQLPVVVRIVQANLSRESDDKYLINLNLKENGKLNGGQGAVAG